MPGYDAARTVWNAMIDRRPRMIVPRRERRRRGRPRYAWPANCDLEIGVRCGGHNVAGLAVPDGGLMIDLTPMSGVRVDPTGDAPGSRAARCSAHWTGRPSRTASPRPPATSRTPASAA